MIRIPVRTTVFVKEEHLRHRKGHLLVDHPHTDMTHSFIIELEGEEQLLQCGPWEFTPLDQKIESEPHYAEQPDGPPDTDHLEPPPNWEP